MENEMIDKKLIALGYWSQSNEDIYSESEPFLHPFLLVKNSIHIAYDVNNMLEYLQNGFITRAYMDYSFCRFNCGVKEELMGTCDRSDGTYVWPEGLHHYIQNHSILLPKYFVSHVVKNNYKLSALSEDDFDENFFDEYNFEIWKNWCIQFKNEQLLDK
jgi:hypothetical protein